MHWGIVLTTTLLARYPFLAHDAPFAFATLRYLSFVLDTTIGSFAARLVGVLEVDDAIARVHRLSYLSVVTVFRAGLHDGSLVLAPALEHFAGSNTARAIAYPSLEPRLVLFPSDDQNFRAG